MARSSRRHTAKPSEAQHHATMVNLTLANFARLQALLHETGHYNIEAQVRNLDEVYRDQTHSKEK